MSDENRYNPYQYGVSQEPEIKAPDMEEADGLDEEDTATETV